MSAPLCPICNKEAPGNYCAHCGAEQPRALAALNWKQETNVPLILKHPEVRDRLERLPSPNKPAIDGEKAAKAIDTVIGLFGPSGVLTKIAIPFYIKIGIKCRRKREASIKAPIGEVVVAALGFAIETGMVLESHEHDPKACTLVFNIPSNMRTYKGTLTCALTTTDTGVNLQAEALFPGQIWDWRRGKELLTSFLEALERVEPKEPVTY